MAQIDFPNAPTDGQVFTTPGGVAYQWIAARTLWATGPGTPSAPLNSPTFTGDPQAPTPAAGDNDNSIATTAWVKSSLRYVLPEWFGAVGNGVTDDTAALQAAIAAVPNGVVLLGSKNYVTTQTLNLANSQTLRGLGRVISGIICNVSGVNVISLSSNGAAVVDLAIYDQTGTRSAGAFISLPNATRYNRIDNVYMGGPFIGIDFGAAGPVICDINSVYMSGLTPATGIGVRLLGGADLAFKNLEIVGTSGSECAYGVLLRNTGGAIFTDCDIMTCITGLGIIPNTAGQIVEWCQFEQVSCDTCSGNGTIIQASLSGLTVTGIVFADCWSSTCAQAGIYVGAGAGTVSGVAFVNHRALNNGHEGMVLDVSNSVQVTGGFFCGNSAATPNTYAGISVKANATKFGFTNVKSGSGLGFNPIQKYGIEVLDGTCRDYAIIGCDLTGNNVGGLNNLGYVGSVSGNAGTKNKITPTVGASPFTWLASMDGTLYIIGGTVTNIALLREGVSFPLLNSMVVIPVTTGDQVQIVYSAAPALTFFPK
jgi:hypothetical protein